MIFPQSFFDIMVHLHVHLVREIKFYGPVYLRWMYPIENYFERVYEKLISLRSFNDWKVYCSRKYWVLFRLQDKSKNDTNCSQM